MKTDTQNSITLRIPSSHAAIIRNLKNGSEVTARIAIRHGKNEAVIDIGGERIKAQFLRGVPEGSVVKLRLENYSNNTYIFKIVTGIDANQYKDFISDHFLARSSINFSHLKSVIMKFADVSGAGLFALNARLLNLEEPKKNENSPVRLLNRLMEMGFSKSALQMITGMLWSLQSPILSILPFLLPAGDEKRKKPGHQNQYDIKESVKKILQEVDSITDVEEKKEVLQLLIGLYNDQPVSRDLPHTGELPFFNGDSFQSVQYIVSKDSLVVSANFTVLGTVEILARDVQAALELNIYCDTEETMHALHKSKNELMRSMKMLQKPVHLHFHDRNAIINKIVEINLQYASNSEIDVTV